MAEAERRRKKRGAPIPRGPVTGEGQRPHLGIRTE